MGFHRLPAPDVISRVSDGLKMAVAVFGAAIMMTIVIVLLSITVLVVVDVLSRPAGGCAYLKRGPCGGIGTGQSRPGTKTTRGCSQFAKNSWGMT